MEGCVEEFPGSRMLLKGGLPHGLCLLLGPSGSGKSVFCRQFAAQSLKKGKNLIAVLTDEPPDAFFKELERLNVNLNEVKNKVTVIDAYSWKIAPSSGERAVSTLGALHEVSAMFDKERRRLEGARIIFDSFDAVVLNAGRERAFRMAQTLAARAAQSMCFGFLTLSPGVHGKRFEEAMRSLCVGVLELQLSVEPSRMRRYLRIMAFQSPHETRPMEFEIVDGEVRFLAPPKKDIAG